MKPPAMESRSPVSPPPAARRIPRVWAWPFSLTVAAAATNAALTVAKPNAGPVPKELHDIKGPIDIATLADWALRAGVVLAALGLLAFAWWRWRRQRPQPAPPQLIPPDERARQRLTAALALLEQPERFCTTVSEIARTYLEERFGLKAPERTTEEFLAELPKNAVLESRHKTLMSEFLTRTDLVKFARFEPDRAELEALHASALRLVEETAPRFVSSPVTDPGAKP